MVRHELAAPRHPPRRPNPPRPLWERDLLRVWRRNGLHRHLSRVRGVVLNPRDPYDAQRIREEAEIIRDLRELGGVELRPRRRRIGFEQRLERADSRTRADGMGVYIDRPWDTE